MKIRKVKTVDKSGTIRFYNEDGHFHREDGPALIYKKGNKEWFKNGKRHNDNGPAVIYSDGSKFWYKNNGLHREDGPAVVYPDGSKKWYLNGKELTQKEFKVFLARKKSKFKRLKKYKRNKL